MKIAISYFLLLLITMSFTPISNTGIGYDESARIKITKAILNNLVQQQYEEVSKNFHVTLKQNLPTEKINEVWTTVVSTYGAYKETLTVRTDVFQGFSQVKIRCQFENEKATLEATFTEDDRVIGLYIKP